MRLYDIAAHASWAKSQQRFGTMVRVREKAFLEGYTARMLEEQATMPDESTADIPRPAPYEYKADCR